MKPRSNAAATTRSSSAMSSSFLPQHYLKETLIEYCKANDADYDSVWIVDDNAKSHEKLPLEIPLLLSSELNASSPTLMQKASITMEGASTFQKQHSWNPKKDSVVGFANPKTDRWNSTNTSSTTTLSPSPLGASTNHRLSFHERNSSLEFSIRSLPKELQSLPFQSINSSSDAADSGGASSSVLYERLSRSDSALVMPLRRSSNHVKRHSDYDCISPTKFSTARVDSLLPNDKDSLCHSFQPRDSKSSSLVTFSSSECHPKMANLDKPWSLFLLQRDAVFSMDKARTSMGIGRSQSLDPAATSSFSSSSSSSKPPMPPQRKGSVVDFTTSSTPSNNDEGKVLSSKSSHQTSMGCRSILLKNMDFCKLLSESPPPSLMMDFDINPTLSDCEQVLKNDLQQRQSPERHLPKRTNSGELLAGRGYNHIVTLMERAFQELQGSQTQQQ